MRIRKLLTYTGPGMVVAATGIGAGDMVAASVGCDKYGYRCTGIK